MSDHFGQMDLIDWAQRSARAADPETSRLAAERAGKFRRNGWLLVLEHLSVRPMTDFDLAAATGWQQTSIGKRRLECQRAGFVDRARDGRGEDVTRESPSGSPALVWAITPEGIEFYRRAKA